jgi:hypothetical protein
LNFPGFADTHYGKIETQEVSMKMKRYTEVFKSEALKQVTKRGYNTRMLLCVGAFRAKVFIPGYGLSASAAAQKMC